MTGVSPTPSNAGQHARWGHFLGAAAFLTLYMVGMLVLIGIFYNNMVFADYYTHLSEMPASSFYRVSRYSSEWWFLYWFAFFNLVAGYLFAAAVCNNAHPMWAKVHKWWCGLTLFANLIFFVAFSILWLFFCNTGYNPGTPCSDVRWCCSHFVDKPDWCQNVVGCVATTGLSISPEFFTVWIYSILLVFMSWAFLSLNKHFWSVGMFMESSTILQDMDIDDTNMNTSVVRLKDGREKTISYPKGSILQSNKDGSFSIVLPDGRIISPVFE